MNRQIYSGFGWRIYQQEILVASVNSAQEREIMVFSADRNSDHDLYEPDGIQQGTKGVTSSKKMVPKI